MAVIPIEDPAKKGPPKKSALWALGFRPFFLLAGIAALTLVAVWAMVFAAGRPLTTYYGYIGWHSHEMVFGYAVAAIAGFLLTATRNWTGLPTARGAILAGLAAVWLAGRLLPLFPAVPGGVVAAVDLAFLPLLALALAVPVIRAEHWKSLMFPVLLLVLAGANLAIHLERLGLAEGVARQALYGSVDLVVILIALMGGRVIPFFTEKALEDVQPRTWAWVERTAIPSIAVLAVAEAFYPQPALVGGLAVLAAVVNGVRFAGWLDRKVWSVPLLWVLHLAYGWLVLGFAMKAAAAFGGVSPLLALHALTVGGIGGATLGMMARVSLGHTGRTLDLPEGMAVAFGLLHASAAVRVLAPLAWPSAYAGLVGFSGALWALAFLLFVIRYTPILYRPRVDGRPG